MTLNGVKIFSDDPDLLIQGETTIDALNSIVSGLGSACQSAINELQANKLRPVKISYVGGNVVASGKASMNGSLVNSSSYPV